MSLLELRVRDLAVVRDAVLPMGPGFTVLTGETGAGKSLCVTALRLALGGRADGAPVRTGAARAVASAVFDDVPAALRGRLGALGVPADDLVTLTREISRQGRAGCRINGALVSLAVLREAGEMLAEVTVQGASHRLLHRSRQRELLDLAGGLTGLVDQVRAAVLRWREALEAREEMRRAAAAGAAEVDAAAALVAQLGPLELRSGEEGGLVAERLRLRHAGALRDAASRLHRALGGDEDAQGAADVLAAALEPVAAVAGVDPGLDALGDDGARLLDELRELAAAARRHAAGVAVDDARLAAVEERLDVIARVRRRHGSVEDALAALGAALEMLDARQDGGERLATAEAAAEAAADALVTAALELSGRRRHAAARLTRDIEAALSHLELPHARLRVALARTPDPEGIEVEGARVRCTLAGIDEVEMQLATDRDATPVPLDAGPSGGELSRLALALSAGITESGSPLLVLDEVDAGLGGETAARVGDLLAHVGRGRQVLAITHRAEIASRADHHLLVEKLAAPGGSDARVRPLEGDDRIAEIARLMSGRVTEAARVRALELRGEAVEGVEAVVAGRDGPRRRGGVAGRSGGTAPPYH